MHSRTGYFRSITKKDQKDQLSAFTVLIIPRNINGTLLCFTFYRQVTLFMRAY